MRKPRRKQTKKKPFKKKGFRSLKRGDTYATRLGLVKRLSELEIRQSDRYRQLNEARDRAIYHCIRLRG